MHTKPVYTQLTEIAAELLSRPELELQPSARLEELGLDSVERVELLARVEDRFDVTIPQEDAIHLTTVEALARYLTVNAP